MAIACLGEGCSDFFDVLRAAGFEGDVDDSVAEADAVISAVVGGFDNVGALVGDDAGEVVQGAGAIGEVNANPDPAAVFDEAALDDF